jgi:hypothetical protein
VATTYPRPAPLSLTIADAQRDVRLKYLGGFAGQLVSGLLWGASAALGTWSTHRAAIIALVFGGMTIFPLTLLVLRLMGRRAFSPRDPLNGLAMQIAFIVPLCLPVAGAAALLHINWFYPAVMIVLGAHYLPFTFLYGMRQFLALGALLITAGLLIGLYLPRTFTLGGWLTAALLLVFALTGRLTVAAESAAA